MQNTETVSNTGCCQIVSISEFGSRDRESRRMGKGNMLDRRFRELSPDMRRHVLYNVIGYCEAMADGISAGRASMDDEISRIV